MIKENVRKFPILKNIRAKIVSSYIDFVIKFTALSYESILENQEISLPFIPKECEHNAHMFYIKCKDLKERTKLIAHLKKNNINAVFHYIPLQAFPKAARLRLRFCQSSHPHPQLSAHQRRLAQETASAGRSGRFRHRLPHSRQTPAAALPLGITKKAASSETASFVVSAMHG